MNFHENEPCKSIKVFRAYLTALACNIEEMRDTNKNKLVPNNAQGRRQIMKFNLPILGSSPAGNSIQTETHKFSQTNSQPRPPNIYPTLRIFTLYLAFSGQWENIIASSTSNEFLLFQSFLPFQILSLRVTPILTRIFWSYLKLLTSSILTH